MPALLSAALAALGLVDRVYEAAIDPDAWQRVAEGVHEALQAAQTTIRVGADLPEGLQRVFRCGSYAAPPHDAALRFVADNAIVGVAPGSLCLDAGTVLIECLRAADASPYGTAEASLLELLLPHVARACTVARRAAAAERDHRALAGIIEALPCAVILVDRRGRPVHGNRSAERLIAAGDSIRADDAGVRGVLREDRGLVEGAIAEALNVRRGSPRQPPSLSTPGAAARQLALEKGSTSTRAAAAAERALDSAAVWCSLRRPSKRSPLCVSVAPLPVMSGAPQAQGAPGALSDLDHGPPAAALFVTETDRPIELPEGLLRRLYGLTAAEERLTLLLTRGAVLKEAAFALGISPNTARNQLRQVFQKTGTDGQAALLRLLTPLALLPVPDPPP